MKGFSIPRGFALLAGGRFDARDDYSGDIVLEVKSGAGDPDWTISQSPYLREKARTTAFSQRVVLNGENLSYSESTMLQIYGREYNHTDVNRLSRA
jgi:hypothetical protein